MLLEAELLGLDASQIDVSSCEVPLHKRLVAPYRQLVSAAREAGFDLCAASGYRSFERQLAIWSAKASGQRPVLDSDGKPLNIHDLSPKERVFAILRWSALPGASRHHWGSEIDIYDQASLAENETLQLTVAETEAGGPFYDFYQWLDDFLPGSTLGFYRPYRLDLGGVAPEPWHLSFAPIADVYQANFSVDIVRRCIVQHEIALKAEILASMDEIYERFVCQISPIDVA